MRAEAGDVPRGAQLDAAVSTIGRYLDRRFGELVAPGVQLALTDRTHTLAVLCRGLANVDARTPVEPRHRFEIGSISKGFLAMALMQEHEGGRLDLDAPVTTYLPWLEMPSLFPPITVHHLLSHTGGLIEGTDFSAEAAYEVWSLRELEPGFAPGERFWYSNLGYKALGLVLEALTGRPWFETVHERVMVPAGMAAASPVIVHGLRPSLAVGYGPPFDDRPWQPAHGLVAAPWSESGTADGTICASADELAGYVRLLLNDGRGVVSAESFTRMSSRIATDEDAPGEVYGYGLRWVGDRMLGHSGSTIGYAAHASCDPTTGFGVAICTNGIGPRGDLARFALGALGAAAAGGPMPDVTEPADPASVSDAARYRGTYVGGPGTLVIAADGDRLHLEVDGRRARLLPFEVDGTGMFLVEDPRLDRFVLRFDVDDDGEVLAVHHGADRFERPGRPEASRPPTDRGWSEIVGHYRTHDPWVPHVRVFLRDGVPWLQDPTRDEARYHERPLAPLADGSFRVGEGWSPDRIRFDTVIGGLARRAVYDGSPMYRTFTP